MDIVYHEAFSVAAKFANCVMCSEIFHRQTFFFSYFVLFYGRVRKLINTHCNKKKTFVSNSTAENSSLNPLCCEK